MNELIMIIVVILTVFLLSLDKNSIDNVLQNDKFKIISVTVILYIIYTSVEHGFILFLSLLLIVLILKPEVKNMAIDKIKLFLSK